MAVSISGTTLTFNDATTQTTARTSSNTVTSVAAGSGISVSGSTGAVTISATGGGTVTSVATGNGLSGGTITSTGTLVIAAPSYNSVGSYCNGIITTGSAVGNTNYAAGTGASQMQGMNVDACGTPSRTNNFSGTWRAMCGSSGVAANSGTLFVRIS